MEANLQKLKVPELKDLLAKHHLVQSGKKDDLIKRLLDNNVGIVDDVQADDDDEEELVDPDVAVPETSNVAENGAAANTTDTAGAAPATTVTTTDPTPTLTEEQKQLKLRAERFGIPFNPNPSSTPKSKSTPSSKSAANVKSTGPTTATENSATPKASQEKKGIDSNPLGLSEEVLAKRAAKFGLSEKKDDNASSAAVAVKETPAPAEKKTEEITPEMAEKIAIEEEKKRKRLEKFGPVKMTASNGAIESSDEPDAKKIKV